MKETEVKFRVKGFNEVREKLKEMEAELIWKGIEESSFYDTGRYNLKRQGKTLRLRSWKGNRDSLTLKTSPERTKGRYKVRGEYEVTLDDFKAGKKIMDLIGFRETFSYRKYREHWKLGSTFVELDRLGRLHFVEIEASPKQIDELAEKLGLEWKNASREGYITILKKLSVRRRNERKQVTEKKEE